MTRIIYRDNSGTLIEGVIWCPGPHPRSVWVLPESGARNVDGVIVKLSPRKGNEFEGEHKQVHYAVHSDGRYLSQVDRLDNRHAPKLSERDWRALIGEAFE